MFVREMRREECQAVVAAGDLARLACCKDGQPYIVPITYAHSGNCLYCFSMPGQKIDWMRSNSNISLQIDEFVAIASGRAWSLRAITANYQRRRRAAAASAFTPGPSSKRKPTGGNQGDLDQYRRRFQRRLHTPAPRLHPFKFLSFLPRTATRPAD